MSDEGFLSRWSRRKHAAAAGNVPAEERAAAPQPPPTAGVAAGPPAPPPSPDPAPPPPLPPVESLGIDSDFAPFMAKEVDPGLQRAALRKLFADERFNVMDRLDVYIDDYTQSKPIPPEWYERMAQMAHLGDAAPRVAPAPASAEGGEGPGATVAAPAPDAAAAPAASETPRGVAEDISQDDISSREVAPTRQQGAPE